MRIFRKKFAMKLGICLMVVGIVGMIVRSYTAMRIEGEADMVGMFFAYLLIFGIPAAIWATSILFDNPLLFCALDALPAQ